MDQHFPVYICCKGVARNFIGGGRSYQFVKHVLLYIPGARQKPSRGAPVNAVVSRLTNSAKTSAKMPINIAPQNGPFLDQPLLMPWHLKC